MAVSTISMISALESPPSLALVSPDFTLSSSLMLLSSNFTSLPDMLTLPILSPSSCERKEGEEGGRGCKVHVSNLCTPFSTFAPLFQTLHPFFKLCTPFSISHCLYC